MSAPPTINLQDFLSRRLEQRIEEMGKVLGYLQLTSDWRTARMISQSIRECEAAQRIVEEAKGRIESGSDDTGPLTSGASLGTDVLQLLATAYSDRADYREEWRP